MDRGRKTLSLGTGLSAAVSPMLNQRPSLTVDYLFYLRRPCASSIESNLSGAIMADGVARKDH